MTRLSITFALILAGLISSNACLADEAQREGEYMTDEQGRRFRVAFDPARRLSLGLGYGLDGNNDTVDDTLTIWTGLEYRFVFDYGSDEYFVQWRLDHQFLVGSVEPESGPFMELPNADIALYRGWYERHATDSYITFPSTPPSRVFFPFDIGIEAELGRYHTPIFQAHEGLEIAQISVLRGALWLDPWRSETPGTNVAFGVGPRYDLDLGHDTAKDETRVTHRIAPFSALMARIRWSDNDGLTQFDLRGDFIPHWSSEQGWTYNYEAALLFERVLISLNDTPLSLRLQASLGDVPAQAGHPFAWEAQGGLLWALPL